MSERSAPIFEAAATDDPLRDTPQSPYQLTVATVDRRDATKDLEQFDAEHVAALVTVLGVGVSNLSEAAAIELMEAIVSRPFDRSRAIYFVNTHTLNTATPLAGYRALLNRAYRVFGDGTGVRWAARAHGVRLHANLNGTDLVPRFFRQTAGQGYRYYLLGATHKTVVRAAENAAERFPGWDLAGYHHGYVDHDASLRVIDEINELQPHLLLVGMGNPLQEQWIDRYLARLEVPLVMGTGGLFDHWAGNLRRAPGWVRWLGHEWFQLLLQQPHKWRRYLLGNPLFLCRIVTHWMQDHYAR